MTEIDYKDIGLMVGLELHIDLLSEHKLFCKCPPVLRKEEPDFTFTRKLRPTQSELGEYDPAALFEMKKGMTFIYEGYRDTTCLVEADESPPHTPDEEIIDTGLTVALLLHSTPVDEIHVMRKIVIDGSNTSGFQRTFLVATGGYIDVKGKRIPIQTISLEEDAARKMRGGRFTVTYRLDRLGIPLIEIATAPVISSPEEAGEVAEAIGRVVMATGKAKSELGMIRQDVNLSIKGGSPTEIKGIQRLGILPEVVRNEVKRQLGLLSISDRLNRRDVEEDLEAPIKDVTDVFLTTRCKVIERSLKRKGRVLAVKLPGFRGLLGLELAPDFRFGTELAERAIFWSGVDAIFHSDEMPTAGMTKEEVEGLKRSIGAREKDAVVVVADEPEKARDALEAVIARCREAIRGLPSDTRMSDDHGVTHYMRPRPGAARIYPETDIPPIRITAQRLHKIKGRLPEMPDEKVKRLIAEYSLSHKLANQLVFSPYASLFERLAQKTEVPASIIAVTLTEILTGLRREGFYTEGLAEDHMLQLLSLIDKGITAKESIPDVLRWLAKHRGASAMEGVKALGLEAISRKELLSIVDEAIRENMRLVRTRGLDSVSSIVGRVMGKVRGKADGRLVRDTVEERISKIIG